MKKGKKLATPATHSLKSKTTGAQLRSITQMSFPKLPSKPSKKVMKAAVKYLKDKKLVRTGADPEYLRDLAKDLDDMGHVNTAQDVLQAAIEIERLKRIIKDRSPKSTLDERLIPLP